MNKTINFGITLIDLAGEPVLNPMNNEPITLGSQLAPKLAQHTSGDALKLYGWAVTIYKNQDVSLDKSDRNTLENFINASDMSNLVKAQLLEVLNAK